MNLVLLETDELGADAQARVTDRRAEHIREILAKGVGDTLRVGVVDGLIGEATILEINDSGVLLRCDLSVEPKPPPQRTLVLALPRPPVFRRVLQHATALGVAKIILLQSKRVEKSYWSSPSLQPGEIGRHLRLGLEQAADTRLPIVETHRRFLPFAEDVLPSLIAGHRALLADPDAPARMPADIDGPVLVAIGPEGGFIPHEVERLSAAGLEPVHLGQRVVRVETAVVAALARLGLP